jgi:ribokinase
MASPPSVLVIGSVNEDITVRVPRFPAPGETLLGLTVTYGLGGKGANQAVAAAHAGVSTSLLATVGDDAVGRQLVGWLAERGVDTTLVCTADGFASGTAHITVDTSGENQIVVVPGANHAPLQVDADVVAAASIVVLQGEVPASTIERAVLAARTSGTRVLLNLAPMLALTPETLAAVDCLVVNETEAGLLLGQRLTGALDNALAAVEALTAISTTAVVTLGAQGAVWCGSSGEAGHLPAPPVTAVDTTGAGDAFVGVMAAAVARGYDLPTAVAAGIAAAALSVQLPGAAMTYPDFAT